MTVACCLSESTPPCTHKVIFWPYNRVVLKEAGGTGNSACTATAILRAMDVPSLIFVFVALAVFRMHVLFYNESGAAEPGIDGGGLFKEFLDRTARLAFDPA